MVLCCYHLCIIKNWVDLCKKQKKQEIRENIHDEVEVVKLLLQTTYIMNDVATKAKSSEQCCQISGILTCYKAKKN